MTDTARSLNQRITRAAIRVMLFVVLAKLVATFKEMVVAWRYGVSEVVDGYLLVFNLVSWPIGVWLSVLTVVLVPLVTRMQHQHASDLPAFRTEMIALAGIVGLSLSLLAWLGLPILIDSTWLGATEEVRITARQAIPALALVPLIGAFIGLFSVLMLIREQHANTLYEGLPALGIACAILLLPAEGLTPLLWGTIVGLVMQLVAVLAPHMHRFESSLPGHHQTTKHWSFFWQGFGLILLGQAIMSATIIVDQLYAASLPAGSIAILGYANRIMALLLGLGATVISRATLPVFSSMEAHDGRTSAWSLAKPWLIKMFSIGIAVMLIGWVSAPWLVDTLFLRGAFTIDDAAMVVIIFRISLLQLPLYYSLLVYSSLLTSFGAYKSFFLAALIFLIAKILFLNYFVDFFGLTAIALSTAAAYAISAIFIAFLHTRTINGRGRGA